MLRRHVTALLITAAFASAARLGAQTSEPPPAEDGLEYAVYVDALNLRAESTMDAEILTVLKAGAVVEHDYSWPYEEDATGVYWWKVRAGGAVGWVDSRYLIPRYQYDAYREADRLGKAGDAAGMVAALNAATASLKDADWVSAVEVVPSPDGRKAIVGLFAGEDGYHRFFGFEDCLYFETGKGLVGPCGATTPGLWSADSRYYAFVDTRSYVDVVDFDLFDAVTGGEKTLGSTYRDGPVEYVDGYLVWLDFELAGEYAEPRLAAYELATGKTAFLLQTDAATVRRNSDGVEEVKLVPAGPCPPALKGSRLYAEFNGAYVARGDYGA